ncbi:MAG: SapC family protein, partial [Pseudomonadota bacterium]
MIYGEPVPLRGDDRRIYAPWSYERLASAAILPIVASEVEALSGAFPVVWAQEADALTLCILRSFRQDGLGLLPIPNRLEVLPLLALAYPVRLDAASASLCLDDVVAENPTDGGAPLFEASGTPSAGLEMKVSALSRYRANLAFTQSLTEALQERDLLEPWQIPTKDIENPWQRPFLIWSRTRDANAQLPHIVSE